MSEHRPQVTLALCTYNQARFVEAALRAAAAQRYRPLEIIIADDASQDGTLEVVQATLAKLRTTLDIRVLAATQNGGLVTSINRIMAIAKGELIVIAAGDDVSMPDRVERLVERWQAGNGETYSVFSNGWVIDDEERRERIFYPSPPNPAEYSLDGLIREGSKLLGAAHAWDRRVFEVFGPLPQGVVYEDWAIAFRSALLGRIDYVDARLVHYRRHGGNVFLGSGAVQVGRAAWRAAQLRQAEYVIPAMQCWLRDLATAERVLPSVAPRAAAIRAAILERLREAEDRLLMFRGAPLGQRLRVTLRQVRAGMPPRRLAQWIMTFFLPDLYFRRLCRIAEREAIEFARAHPTAPNDDTPSGSGRALSASHA